jgi:hypothetical protein
VLGSVVQVKSRDASSWCFGDFGSTARDYVHDERIPV